MPCFIRFAKVVAVKHGKILLETDDAVSQPFRESIYGETREIPFSKRTTRPLSSFAAERIWESQLRSTQEVYTPPSAPHFIDNRGDLNQENTTSGANLAPFPDNPLPCFLFYWGGKQAPVEENSTDQQENVSPVD